MHGWLASFVYKVNAHYAINKRWHLVLQLFSFYFTVAAVYFNQSAYSVNENDGIIQFVLALNTSIAVDVIVLVESNDITANGE